ncbi:hypothetical protein BDV96DRAFT_617596 [Lophiotrema nucula]|uniref:Uncharacterized protein n=1 Tax=Lophiotrema nucula TaxID=690887 RepID=A0A6A5YG64_9PLEO|nr:hypothetical protein BDV96DRAFT_617596 [Lophiotrema nucula]
MTTGNQISRFQFYHVASDADWHTLNEGDEINRSNVTDESTDGFTIAVTLEKAIHGEGDNLNSFIGLHFGFLGVNEKRRFRSVVITIRFEDVAKPLIDDPEVIKIWPDTEYVWQGMTKEIEDTKSVDGQLKAGAYGGEGSIGGKWQRQEKFVRNTPARLSGNKTLMLRKAGSHKNAMLIRMHENSQEGSGVLRELRAAILVARKHKGAHRFRAHVSIKAEADFRFGVIQGLKKLVGADHCTDPIIFEPGTNFLDEGDIAGINGKEPGVDMVSRYGDAASATELVKINKTLVKQDGEWREVADDAPAARTSSAVNA